MKTVSEKLKEAKSFGEAQQIQKDFWDNFKLSDRGQELLDLLYKARRDGKKSNDSYVIELEKELETEKQKSLIEQGFFPKDHVFNKPLSEEAQQCAIDWFGSNEDE